MPAIPLGMNPPNLKMRRLISFVMYIFHLYVIVLVILVPLSSCFPLSLKKDNNPIESICEHAPNYEVCLSTLLSDSRSFNADIENIGLIVIEALRGKATRAMEIIKKLKKTNPELIKPLTICGLRYYAVLNADIPQAVAALTKGVPKFAEDAMADSALEAKVCEQSFLVLVSKSPLTDTNTAVYVLSLVAKSIISNLL